ncbi:MAG TPA: alpha/beta hydrolase [Myxococcales bacterium]|nr:alpha/beta hydrolase [Myxococcales bacterium]
MNHQVLAFIEMLKATIPGDAPKMWQLTPAQAREQSERFFAPFNSGGPQMAEVREVRVGGRRGEVAARLYVPRGIQAISRGMLYLHGGGFVVGSLKTHDRLARELAQRLSARVLSLDYGLAPEHPYPQGLDDCVDAARWLVAHAGVLAMDLSRLIIGGDSAGASLSAGTLLRLRDEGSAPLFCAAIFLYGRFSVGETDSLRAWGDRELILSRRQMKWFSQAYAGSGAPPVGPYLAPVEANLQGLPPSILVVGTMDPLLSDSQLFASALQKAGVRNELHVYPDGIHAFLQMPMFDMTNDALEKIAAFVRRC